MARPKIINEPTYRQQIAVFNLIQTIERIVAKGKLTPDDAIEAGRIAIAAKTEFGMSFRTTSPRRDPEEEQDLKVISEVLKS